MRSDRLLKLAAHLESLWPDVFDMTTWAEIRPGCGTVCCALGHATTLFAGEGLRLRWDYAPDELRAGDAAVVRYYGPGLYPPAGYAAAAVFFGLGPEEAIHLFAPFAYRDEADERRGPDITPYEVAERIRDFVGDKDKKPGKVVFR